MKLYLTTILTIISLFAYSQTKFQKGYFLKVNGDKVDCLIKNEDWNKSPNQFSYKLSENSEILVGNIAQIEEFHILDVAKYLKRTVDIDISSNNIKNLNAQKEPDWETKTVFLKVLLEGKSSLYFYSSPGLNRYYYNIDNGKILQLVYKRYNLPKNKIGENSSFKQQLYNSFLDCSSLSINDFNNISYNSPSLSKILIAYNNCSNSETVILTSKNNNPKFNLRIKGGLNSSSVKNVEHGFLAARNAEFGTMLGYRFALEGEIVLPFNNNKWSIFFELAKVQDIDKVAEESSEYVRFTYSYFELPLAVRHYIFLNDNSKISFHLGYAWDVSADFELDYENLEDMTGEYTSGGLFFGGGFHFNKFLIEGRMHIKSVFEANTASYTSNYNNLSLTIGYTIL